MRSPLSGLVWAVLAGAVVLAWVKNWRLHVPPDAPGWRALVVGSLYLLGLLFCLSSVLGAL